MPIRKDLIDELMKEAGQDPDLFGEDGLLTQLKRALVERALEAEMTHHLGYEKGAPEGRNGQNYRTEVSAELVSAVTAEVVDEVRAWQTRPLAELYPILYLDALFVTTKEGGPARRKAINLVVGVRIDGYKEVLGIWISETEGAKFWLSVLTELKNRGVRDIFIACVDGLTGFGDAIRAAFPGAIVQRCIVHQIRNSLAFVTYADRKAVASALKPIYRAAT